MAECLPYIDSEEGTAAPVDEPPCSASGPSDEGRMRTDVSAKFGPSIDSADYRIADSVGAMADLWAWCVTGGATTIVLIELLLLNRQRRLLLLDTQHCRFFVAHTIGRCRDRSGVAPR